MTVNTHTFPKHSGIKKATKKPLLKQKMFVLKIQFQIAIYEGGEIAPSLPLLACGQ